LEVRGARGGSFVNNTFYISIAGDIDNTQPYFEIIFGMNTSSSTPTWMNKIDCLDCISSFSNQASEGIYLPAPASKYFMFHGFVRTSLYFTFLTFDPATGANTQIARVDHGVTSNAVLSPIYLKYLSSN
jgi:hypothetical protein